MKLTIGFYGAVVNFTAVLGALVFSALRNNGSLGADLFAAPLLAVSGFLVYYFIVSSYVEKRSGAGNPVYFDSLVGMLAELVIVTLSVVIYSAFTAFANSAGGIEAFAAGLAANIMVNLLWVLALFMVHILLLGNAAGLLGWYLLKKNRPGPRAGA